MIHKLSRFLMTLVALMAMTTGAWAQWNGGTYEPTQSEQINGTIQVNADAVLTLNENITVTVNGGIAIADGATLTVKGPGKLVVNGTAGTDGSYNNNVGVGGTAITGNIIIQGATVEATGGKGGNGYTSSNKRNGGLGGAAFTGAVTISSGTVIATGGNGGNGANRTQNPGGPGGDGANAFAGTLTVIGGNVEAIGGNGGTRGNAYASNGLDKDAFAANVVLETTPTSIVGGVNANTTAAITDGITTSFKYVKIESADAGTEPITIELTKTGDNEWTLAKMPAADVELLVEYYPLAVLSKAPAAVTDPIYVSTEAGLITPGETSQGTLMYLVTETNEKPATTEGFSADLPTVGQLTAATYYVWYYIMGDDEHSNTEIAATPITATVLTNKYDITFNAANALTIDTKGTVTIGTSTTPATITNNKITDVTMGQKVTINANTGYKLLNVSAGNILVTTTGNTKAEFTMPASNVTVNYTLKRDMAVNVNAAISSSIRIKKEGDTYVANDPDELKPAVTDEINGTTVMEVTTDYTISLEKKGNNDQWTSATALSVGTFRYKVTGAGIYDGEIYTNEFNLFEGYEMEIFGDEYVTYYSNEKLYVEDPDIELYTITAVGTSTVTVTKVTVAPANTPLLVFNKSNQPKNFMIIPTMGQADNVTPYSGFIGTLEATTIPASNSSYDYYAFNGKQFVWVKNAINIAANKAYLRVPKSNNAPYLDLIFGGNTTGIRTADFTDNSEESWYDLNGRKLQSKPNTKGIYIMNGKKVVVK